MRKKIGSMTLSGNTNDMGNRESRSDLRYSPLRAISRLMPLTYREAHENMPVMQQARARLSILFIACEGCGSV